MHIIDILSVTILLSVCVMLIVKVPKKREDWLLLMSMASILIMAIIESFESDSYFIGTIPIFIGVSLGPILIYYFQTISGVKSGVSFWLYLVPSGFLLCFILFGAFSGYSDTELYYNPMNLILNFVCLIAVLVYGFIGMIQLHKIKVSEAVDVRFMQWFYVLIGVYFTNIFIEFIYLFVYSFANDSLELWLTDALISLAIVVLLFWKGISLKIFMKDKAILEGNGTESDRWLQLYESIHEKVTGNVLFLKHDLRIDDVAREMKSNSKYISKAINEGAGESFTNYLNTLRLNKFKEALQDESNGHINLFALAEECGFSSKSSFNRFFKMKEGMTPSEYRDTIRQ